MTDQNNRKGNYLESSASSLFVYFLCKAVNKGYIPVEYKAAAERGFNGLIKQFIKEEPDGSYTITNCCAVAGLGGKGNRDGSFAYYLSLIHILPPYPCFKLLVFYNVFGQRIYNRHNMTPFRAKIERSLSVRKTQWAAVTGLRKTPIDWKYSGGVMP